MYTFVYRTFIKFILFCHDINQDIARVLSFNALMGLSCYFYQTYIKGHRRGFNALMGLSCYVTLSGSQDAGWKFQCPHGLELLPKNTIMVNVFLVFQCPHGLELLLLRKMRFWFYLIGFNALMGLSCYSQNVFNSLVCKCVSMPSWAWVVTQHVIKLKHTILCFNALMGLSCYGKNVQYFKFFMILFMHPCYL